MELIDLFNSRNSSQIKIEVSIADLEKFADRLIARYRETEIKTEKNSDIGRIDLAMEVTGLTKSTIYSKVSKGEIPVLRREGVLYFSRKMLQEWILEGRQLTNKEIEKNAGSYLK